MPGPNITSVRYTERLALEGIAPSIGTVGDAYDNALMESVNGLYKAECIRTTVFHSGAYKTLADVEYATAGWVDWYNNRRLHSSLGYISPVDYETAHYATLNPHSSGKEPGAVQSEEAWRAQIRTHASRCDVDRTHAGWLDM